MVANHGEDNPSTTLKVEEMKKREREGEREREKGRLDGFVENLVAFSQFLRLNWICELNQQIRRKKTFDCE